MVAPVPTLLGWFSSAPKLVVVGVATVDMGKTRHESNLKTVLVPPCGLVKSHMPKVYLRCMLQVIMYQKKMFETYSRQPRLYVYPVKCQVYISPKAGTNTADQHCRHTNSHTHPPTRSHV